MNFVFNILSIAVCLYMCMCVRVCVFYPLNSHCLMMALTQIQQLFIPVHPFHRKHTQKYSVGVRTHIHSSIQMSTLSQLKEPLHLSLTPDFSTQTPHHCAGGEN